MSSTRKRTCGHMCKNCCFIFQSDSALLGSPPVHAFNEKVHKHNTELTAFVSRLSAEKAELRETLATLEEKIWRYRQQEGTFSQVGGRHACACVRVCVTRCERQLLWRRSGDTVY